MRNRTWVLVGGAAAILSVGTVGEGVDWIRAGDENTGGTNVVNDGIVGGFKALGASDRGAEFGLGAFELGAAGLTLRAPVLVTEKLFTWFGAVETSGLPVYVQAIVVERYRDWSILKPFLDFGKTTYDAVLGK